MNKKEVIWLLIRIAGLYLIWQSVQSLVALSSGLVAAINTPRLWSVSAGVFFQSVLQIGLYLSLGFYMLLNGRLFYHLLSREPDSFED